MHDIHVIDGGVHYARNGDVRLAYRVLGDGDTTLVWVPGWVSNVDLLVDPDLPFTPFFEQLAQGTRFVAWDKRGTGLSDPVTRVPPLDERMDDLHAVMDAAGADCPALFGVSEGGPMSILFAATYPERVRSLILYGTLPRFTPEPPDYPWGIGSERAAAFQEEIENHWGEGALAHTFFGPIADVPGFREMYGRMQRASASPMMALMLWHAVAKIDVRPVLQTVRTPTLVLGRRGDEVAPVEAAAALAAAIPDAEFRELPPGPHGLFDDAMSSAILDFVCGTAPEETGERVLSTVMFTDIVSSTELLSAQGDAHWRHELDAHDRLVDRLLSKYGGQRAKHTGDGVFALFDGPPRPPVAASNSCRPLQASASTSEWACTSANASGAATNGVGWRCTWALGSVGWHKPTRSSPAAPCVICQRGPDCVSKALAPNASRGWPRKPKSTGSVSL